ncbi:hypothetical protein [Yersinia enterocolitica]|uniref:Uncharacterized protein n=1 Tax=Yersinia enterocolitica TaxID=630 RepID=A0A9P1M144_YEREN|nr:hypothetical protein [Yersinia enterocolitica]CNE97386.1 Uncharacterised protein [Yersinia enterocolitica]HEN3356768.1 hypothetical protein [Yersinia enterocolitica]
MKDFKNFFTKILFDIAYKFPFVFPKWIRYYSSEYHSNSDYVKEAKVRSCETKRASLFDYPAYWKAISFSFTLNKEELTKLKRWRKKVSLNNYNDFIYDKIDYTSFDRSKGYMHIGRIGINKEDITDEISPIYLKSNYLDSIFITLSKYGAGLSVITFYFYLNKEASNMINSISIPNMEYFVRLDSLNLFSRKNRSVCLTDKESFAKDCIKKNMMEVAKEGWDLLTVITSNMGIKKRRDDIYCVNDMYLDQNEPYFVKVASNNTSGESILIPRYHHFLDVGLSDNNDEHFIIDNHFNIDLVDMTYMKVCPESTFTEHNNFRFRYCANYESHLAITPVLLIIKRIDALNDLIDNAKLYNKNISMGKLHSSLFHVLHDIQMISGWLSTLKKDIPYSLLAGYYEISKRIIERQVDRVNELQLTVKTFYGLSENRIQVSNIRYNKIYSLVVFIFVIIQVLLAAMTIDWQKKGVWYTPLIEYLKGIFN